MNNSIPQNLCLIPQSFCSRTPLDDRGNYVYLRINACNCVKEDEYGFYKTQNQFPKTKL